MTHFRDLKSILEPTKLGKQMSKLTRRAFVAKLPQDLFIQRLGIITSISSLITLLTSLILIEIRFDKYCKYFFLRHFHYRVNIQDDLFCLLIASAVLFFVGLIFIFFGSKLKQLYDWLLG